MASIRILSSFTKYEREKMYLIHNLYKECIDPELPRELQLDKKKPVYKADVRDWNPEVWVRGLGSNILRPHCETIIFIICEYENERSQRIMGSGYRDDPLVLFLEEMKVWLSKTISYVECNVEARDMILKRIRYLEHVLSEPNLFDPFPSHKMTMQQVIFHCRKVLLYEMVPMINAEISHQAAREDFKQLEKYIFSSLDHCVKFLYSICRSGKNVPVNISISHIRHPNKEKHSAVLNTSSGMLLYELVTSQPFLDAFKDEEIVLEPDEEKLPVVMKSRHARNQFLDSRGNVIIPDCLKKLELDEAKRSNMNLNNCLAGPKSGIEGFFQNNTQVATTFLRCHGLIYEFAKFMVICKQARNLAGQGGDLLVYGLANAQVNVILNSYDYLIKDLRYCITRLNQIAEIRFEQLVNENKARDSTNNWVRHFKKVSHILEQIWKDYEKTDLCTLRIRMQANCMTFHERVNKAKAETVEFVKNSETFTMDLAAMLGVNYSKLQQVDSSSVRSMRGICNDQETNLLSSIAVEPMEESKKYFKVPLKPSLALTMSSPPASILPSIDENPKVLDMSNRNISDTTISTVLIRLTCETTEIDLQRNNLTGQGAMILFEHLCKYFPMVTAINLYNNSLGPEGAGALASVLTRPDIHLVSLDINSNNIGDDGALLISQGLFATSTLIYLDLAYNGITEIGIGELINVMSCPECPILHLKLSGNLFTENVLHRILILLKENDRIIEINVGEAPCGPLEVVEEIGKINYNRRIESDQREDALIQMEKDKKIKVIEQQKLKRMKSILDNYTAEPNPTNPMVQLTKTISDNLIFVKPPSQKDSHYMLEDVLQESDTTYRLMIFKENEIEDEVMSEMDFYPVIRVIRNLSLVSEYPGWVKKSTVAKVLSFAIYDAQIPNMTQTFEEYYEAAIQAEIVETKEIKSKSKTAFAALGLKPNWQKFRIPLPAKLQSVVILQKLWDVFIYSLSKYPLNRRKLPSLLQWARKSSSHFVSASEVDLISIFDMAIYCGVIIPGETGKYHSNLSQKKYPIEVATCPTITFPEKKKH